MGVTPVYKERRFISPNQLKASCSSETAQQKRVKVTFISGKSSGYHSQQVIRGQLVTGVAN